MLALLALAGSFLLAACASTGATQRSARAQQNTAVVLAFLDTVFNKHEVVQAFKLYVGPDYRQHHPGVADGAAAAEQALMRFTGGLHPQLRQEVQRTVAQGDLVAVHGRYVANEGAGGRALDQAVVDIFRLKRGRIVEHWDVVEDHAVESANDQAMF